MYEYKGWNIFIGTGDDARTLFHWFAEKQFSDTKLRLAHAGRYMMFNPNTYDVVLAYVKSKIDEVTNENNITS